MTSEQIAAEIARAFAEAGIRWPQPRRKPWRVGGGFRYFASEATAAEFAARHGLHVERWNGYEWVQE